MPLRKQLSSQRDWGNRYLTGPQSEEDLYWEENRRRRARGDFDRELRPRASARRTPYRASNNIRAARRIDVGHESPWEFYDPDEPMPEANREKQGRIAERTYPSRYSQERRRQRLQRSEGETPGYDDPRERDYERRVAGEFDEQRINEDGNEYRVRRRNEGEYRDEERHFGAPARSRTPARVSQQSYEEEQRRAWYGRHGLRGRNGAQRGGLSLQHRVGDWFEDEGDYWAKLPARISIRGKRTSQPGNRTKAERAQWRAHRKRRRARH